MSETSLASKLHQLLETTRKPDGTRYEVAEVAKAISEQQGVSLSKTYLYNLLNGRNDNPSLAMLEALAGWFRVSLDYFGADSEISETIQAHLAQLATLERPDVQMLLARGGNLSREQLQPILQMMEHLDTNPDSVGPGENAR